jgi:hypothetical protein
MKRCPFCAEEIQDEAIKCKHCGEFMIKKTGEKWYLKTSILILAFLTIGPFALPMLWFNPRYSKLTKITVSVIVLVITYYLTVLLIRSVQLIVNYYGQIL